MKTDLLIKNGHRNICLYYQNMLTQDQYVLYVVKLFL